jgi:hypothetical protein
LTYNILTKQHKIIYSSAIWSALDPAKRNQRLSPLGGETASTYLGDTMYIRYSTPSSEPHPDMVDRNPNVKKRMVTIDPHDFIGRNFLKDAEEDGQRFHVWVICAVVDREEELKKGSEYMKFICKVPNSRIDEIFTYNEILDHIEKDNIDIESDTEQLYKFRCIAAHQGPLRTSDMDYKGPT